MARAAFLPIVAGMKFGRRGLKGRANKTPTPPFLPMKGASVLIREVEARQPRHKNYMPETLQGKGQ